MERTYIRAWNGERLAAELLLAFGASARFRSDNPGAITVTVPDGTDPAQVDTVLTNHDATTPTATQQQAAVDTTTLADLATTYAAMVTKLDAIQADMTTLSANANTLSGITVSGTLAQTQAQVQGALRSLGTDLGTLVTDVQALATGSERVLKAARVFVRRGGG